MHWGQGAGGEKLGMNEKVVEGDLTFTECLIFASSMLAALHIIHIISCNSVK